MKLIHLSDLHLGKRVNEFSMLEDQRFILTKIINIIDNEQPDGIIIAGDVYDKSVPSVEAVELFDDFLYRLAKRGLQVFVISGNHDSPERIAFGGRLMDASGIHMSPAFYGEINRITLQDSFGNVNLYLLPFIKPAHVRKAFPDAEITSYTNAIGTVIDSLELSEGERNVMVAHQFVTGAKRSESEEISVGGLDNVDASVFDKFDYVALGHIHGAQKMGRDCVRYCGTPLKYSFSEANHEKSVTVVELLEKGNVNIRTVSLTPMRDMREIRGFYNDIVNRENYIGTSTDDYMHITLLDEDDVPDAVAKLRVIYPNLMKLDYDNARTRSNSAVLSADITKQKSELELFAEFFEKQNNAPLSDTQTKYLSELIESIKEARQ